VPKDDVDKQAYHADKEAVGPATGGAAPARACCGLKRRTFLIVVAVAAVIVIGAVVGGVVGGLRANKDSDDNTSTGSGPGSDPDAPQPTWTGTGPAPIPTGPIQPSQRSLAVSASADNETQELQLFYQDLGTTDVLLRRIRNDEARTEHKLNLTIPPDWGTSLAAAAVNGTGTGSGSSTTDPVSTQLFYISSAGRANASVVQATLECPPRGETCATRSNTVVSANVTGHRVNARTRLAALRIGDGGGGGGGILRVYYQAEDGSLSVLNGDRAASSGWTTTLVRTGVYMSSAIVAHGPDKDDLSLYYINSTNQLQFLEYSDILGPNRGKRLLLLLLLLLFPLSFPFPPPPFPLPAVTKAEKQTIPADHTPRDVAIERREGRFC